MKRRRWLAVMAGAAAAQAVPVPRTTVTIATEDGLRDVPVIRDLGHFVIIRESFLGLNLTHVGTGRKVVAGQDIWGLIRLAEQLRPFDWSFTDPATTAHMPEAARIVREWWMGR